MLIRPNLAGHSNPLKFETDTQSRKPNNAPLAKPHINICTTTTANNDPNCSARYAHLSFRRIIVIKEHSKPNIIVHIVTAHYSAGKCVSTSLCTNAATITVPIALKLSKNSTHQNKIYDSQNLLNLNSITFTVNTCSKPKILPCHRL